MKEKVIGVAGEPAKLYRVGAFVLRQIPGSERTLEEKDPTMGVLKVLGLANPQSILDLTIQKYWDDLEATGKVKEALAMILEVQEGPQPDPSHKRREAQSYTVGQIVAKMPRRVAAEALQDFFVLNFSSQQQSKVSAGSTASS